MKRTPLIALATLLLVMGVGLVIRDIIRNRDASAVPRKPDVGKTGEVHAPEADRKSRVPALIATLSDLSLHESRHIEAVRGLPGDLTQKEFEELMDLIRGPVPANLSADKWHVIANEIMNVLREPRFHIKGYGGAMGGMVADKGADPVIRDYAAQHLALSLDRVAHASTPADFHVAMETFLTVIANGDESFNGVTGTILMSLTAVSETFHPGDLAPYRERLGEVIVALVSGDRKSSLSNRISAIQAAGRLGFTKALPAIRSYAAGKAQNPSIRLSSVAALGYFADPADRPFLEQLARSNDRLRFAARTALETRSESPSTSR